MGKLFEIILLKKNQLYVILKIYEQTAMWFVKLNKRKEEIRK